MKEKVGKKQSGVLDWTMICSIKPRETSFFATSITSLCFHLQRGQYAALQPNRIAVLIY